MKSTKCSPCEILCNKHFAFVLVLSIAFSACNSSANHSERRFDLQGKIVSVDVSKGEVTVAHKAIPGYMDAMAMPFRLKDKTLLPVMEPGQDISAQLVVDGTSTWLENPVVSSSVKADPATLPSTIRPEPSPGDKIPNFALTNQDGKATTLSSFKGRSVALTFIYTRCPLPDYCVLMNDNFGRVEQETKKDPVLYKKTHLLTVSFDPVHDTPQVLKQFGEGRIGAAGPGTFDHWEFATGTPAQIKAMADFFGLTYVQETNQIVHSLITVVIRPDGTILKIYDGNEWKPEELIADLKSSASGNNQ